MSDEIRGLVIGRSGILATALGAVPRPDGVRLVARGRDRVDVTDQEAVFGLLKTERPDVVINAAGYTDVDVAEVERRQAFEVNGVGTGYLAEACGRSGIPLLHVSSEYVFDGEKLSAYVEDDVCAPLSCYGASKRFGEILALEHCRNAAVVRTAGLFDERGRGLVGSIARAAVRKTIVRAVYDRVVCVTPATDLAAAILHIARELVDGHGCGQIYHYAGQPAVSVLDLAQAVVSEVPKIAHENPCSVVSVSSEEWQERARRPANGALACGKIKRVFGLMGPDWKRAMPGCADAAVRVFPKESGM